MINPLKNDVIVDIVGVAFTLCQWILQKRNVNLKHQCGVSAIRTQKLKSEVKLLAKVIFIFPLLF